MTPHAPQEQKRQSGNLIQFQSPTTVSPSETAILARKVLKALEDGDREWQLALKIRRKYEILERLLGDRDEKTILHSAGSPDVVIRFRRKRRGIYFDYVHEFYLEAKGVQRQRIETHTTRLVGVHADNLRLICYVLGMRAAGVLHFFRLPFAEAVATYFFEAAVPLIYPPSSAMEHFA